MGSSPAWYPQVTDQTRLPGKVTAPMGGIPDVTACPGVGPDCNVAAQLRPSRVGAGGLGAGDSGQRRPPGHRPGPAPGSGRSRHVWWRASLVVRATLPVLRLANVFGQRISPDTTTSPAASMLVSSLVHIRGGLVFTSEFVITPRRPLQNAQLYLDNGWSRA
jgi:hypothetical protein